MSCQTMPKVGDRDVFLDALIERLAYAKIKKDGGDIAEAAVDMKILYDDLHTKQITKAIMDELDAIVMS